jgi:hypothetical protein
LVKKLGSWESSVGLKYGVRVELRFSPTLRANISGQREIRLATIMLQKKAQVSHVTLQTIFDLCFHKKDSAKPHSQISAK